MIPIRTFFGEAKNTRFWICAKFESSIRYLRLIPVFEKYRQLRALKFGTQIVPGYCGLHIYKQIDFLFQIRFQSLFLQKLWKFGKIVLFFIYFPKKYINIFI